MTIYLSLHLLPYSRIYLNLKNKLKPICMNIKLSIICFIPIFCHFLYGYPSNPPNGRTGAPGETTCASGSCHNSYPLDSGSGNVTIYGPTEYNPGEILSFVVNVSQIGQTRWGFELCTRTDDLEQGGEILIEDGVNTQTSTSEGITYLKQTNTGTYNGQSDEAEWEFEWEAPIDQSGTITIYIAGNAANGNGNRLGDYVYTTEYVIEEINDEILPIDYHSQIQPIFDNNCSGYCHVNGGSYTGNLDLSSYEELMSGTSNHGPVITQGDAENSIIIQKLSSNPPFGDQMPAGGPPLDEYLINLIADWIDEGALEFPDEECFPNGDVNFDGNLNILDIVMVIGNILGSDFTDEQSCTADLNEDSEINILDIVTIINIILNS